MRCSPGHRVNSNERAAALLGGAQAAVLRPGHHSRPGASACAHPNPPPNQNCHTHSAQTPPRPYPAGSHHVGLPLQLQRAPLPAEDGNLLPADGDALPQVQRRAKHLSLARHQLATGGGGRGRGHRPRRQRDSRAAGPGSCLQTSPFACQHHTWGIPSSAQQSCRRRRRRCNTAPAGARPGWTRRLPLGSIASPAGAPACPNPPPCAAHVAAAGRSTRG